MAVHADVFDEGGAVINVKAEGFGARGNGVDDDWEPIQRALLAARKASDYPREGTQGAIVFFPPGIYLVSRPINCTVRQSNLVGSGPYQTVIRGRTGAGRAVIDMSGASYSTVRDLMIDDGDPAAPRPAGASEVGILCSRVIGLERSREMADADEPAEAAAAPPAEPAHAPSLAQVNLHNVNVRLRSSLGGARPDDRTNRGSVGVYNFGVEEVNYHNVHLRADTPLVICATNVFGLDSPYAFLPQRQQSMSVVNVTGQSSLVSQGRNALRLHGGAHANVDAFLAFEGPPARAQHAILCTASWRDLRWNGSMEGFPTLLRVENAYLVGADLQGYALYTSGTEMVSLAGNAHLMGGTLRITPAEATDPRTDGVLLRTHGGADQYVQNLLLYLYENRIDSPNPQARFRGNVVMSLRSLAELRARVRVVGENAGNLLMGHDMASAYGVALAGAGPDAGRPPAASVGAGAMYYSTSRRMPLWSDGSAWRTASGESA
ncbi:MAG TPA: glycosyl hydrolase family 28-related protein [Longimicrobium sp.]|nr:glycosyl hydrolase family 28-related protein [Longimicrobium sp.]